MICPSCGNQLEDGLKFCPHCGEKIDPIEAMIKESEPTRSVETPKEDEPVPAPAQPAEKDSSGNKKRIAIAVGIIAAVIIALFAGRAILNKMHEKTYKEANKAYATQKYEEALKGYNKLGDYEDAKSRAKTCSFLIATSWVWGDIPSWAYGRVWNIQECIRCISKFCCVPTI